ncbi:hypothetical protein, partial [Paenibacillus sp. 2TAB19]|uniref:hypothetical protein n=1 Tax=Paenibacillus sp. 2TAB19 TaxID=3233003 RepID=UPI003F963D34
DYHAGAYGHAFGASPLHGPFESQPAIHKKTIPFQESACFLYMAERMGFAPSLREGASLHLYANCDYHAGAYGHAFGASPLHGPFESQPAIHKKTIPFQESTCFFVYGGEDGIRSVAA